MFAQLCNILYVFRYQVNMALTVKVTVDQTGTWNKINIVGLVQVHCWEIGSSMQLQFISSSPVL